MGEGSVDKLGCSIEAMGWVLEIRSAFLDGEVKIDLLNELSA